MGAMGRYVDLLSDDARDRLLEAQTWTPYALVDGGGGGCLRGHAEGFARLQKTYESILETKEADPFGFDRLRDLEARTVFFRFPNEATRHNPAGAFNAACDRFGAPRVVRAIKQRAGKPHRVNTAPVQKHEAAQV